MSHVAMKYAAPPNHYWVPEHTNTLQLIHKMCATHAEAYHLHYDHMRQTLYHYRVPIIGVSTVMGILSISNSGYIAADMMKYVSLIVGIGNFAVAVGAINMLEKIQKIVIEMNTAYVSRHAFRTLGNDLAIALRTPTNQRDTDGQTAVATYYTRFHQILNTSPLLKKMPPNLLTMLPEPELIPTISHTEAVSPISSVLGDGLSAMHQEYIRFTTKLMDQLPGTNIIGLSDAKRKEDHVRVKEDHGRGKEDYVRGKEEHVRVKEDHVRAKEDYVRGKEDYVRGKEDYVRVKEESANAEDKEEEEKNEVIELATEATEV